MSEQLTPLRKYGKSALGTGFKTLGVFLMVLAGGLSMALRHAGSIMAGGELIIFGLMIVTSWAGYAVFKRGKQVKINLADETMEDDLRPPVLYLRSFNSDADANQAEGNKMINHFFRFGIPQNLATEEEQIALLMNQIGPFVAIGRPGEELPQLGAYRTYINDFSAEEGMSLDLFWKGKILELMDKSCLIVMRVGETEGFWWEVGNVSKIIDPKRVIFLLPEKAEDYEPFRKKAEEHLPLTLPDYDPQTMTDRSFGGILWFSDDWTPHLEYCQTTWDSFANRVAGDLNRMMANVWAQLHIKMPSANDEPAPMGKRFAAQGLDLLFFSVIAIIITVGATLLNLGENGVMLVVLGFPLMFFWYFGILEASRFGGTPGKAIMGLKVQDKMGTPLSMQQGLLRVTMKMFMAILWPITIIMLIMGKRTPHEFLSSTMVVMADSK